MEKKGKIIALANRKGGVGKSSATMFLATALFRLGYKVIVFDTDSQGSILDTRRMDLHIYADEIEDENTDLYPIISENPKNLLNEALINDNREKYDFIFFDIPRFTDGETDESLATIISLCDYTICPIKSGQLDNFSIAVLLEMLSEIKGFKQSEGSDLKFTTFLSMSGKRPSFDLGTISYIKNLGHTTFTNGLADILEFAQPSTFKSLLEMSNSHRVRFTPFLNEFCKFVEIPTPSEMKEKKQLSTQK